MLSAVLLTAVVSGFAYIIRHQIIDRNHSQAQPAWPAQVSGEVSDDRGPIDGATVRIKGSSKSVMTDSAGRFHLSNEHSSTGRITASKQGYLIGSASAESSPLAIRLTPLPTEDCEEYTWVDPQPHPEHGHNCGNCHAEIFHEWAGSGHARSVSNRRFQNLYTGQDWRGRPNVSWSLLDEHPNGAGVCSACHAPALAFSNPAYYDLSKAQGLSAQGIHCDYCHKVADVANDQIGLTHGRFGLNLLRPSAGQVFFGPLDDVDRGEDTFSPVYRDSRYCASCHEGTVFGVHAYGTYSEWLESPARKEGKQCQTCHMAPTGIITNIAPGKGGIPRDPRTLASHGLFPGGQEEMLRRCLNMEVDFHRLPVALSVAVSLLARDVGHRVPTGFPDRQLILVVEAFDRGGNAIGPQAGSSVLPKSVGQPLEGRAGLLYAKQLRDFEGVAPVPFWRARPEAVDSRLLPLQREQTTFTFPPHAHRVRVRLIYRRFWREVALAKGWPDDDLTILDRSLVVHQ